MSKELKKEERKKVSGRVIKKAHPSGGTTVRIRGIGSFNKNEPLYVVDEVTATTDSKKNRRGPVATILAGVSYLRPRDNK